MKNAIVCFIGTDGAGKSTLINETKKSLGQEHNLSVKTIYFGWKPFLPTTKLLSSILKKKNYRIAEQMNDKNKSERKKKCSIFQETMLGYYCVEYLSRYFFQLKLPSLFQRNIILVDRYFYDMYAHYQYAEKSFIFPALLKIMPKPDLIFFLDVDIETAKQRKPEMDLSLLKEHHQRYQKLSKLIDASVVKTDQEPAQSVQEILGLIEEKVIKKN